MSCNSCVICIKVVVFDAASRSREDFLVLSSSDIDESSNSEDFHSLYMFSDIPSHNSDLPFDGL